MKKIRLTLWLFTASLLLMAGTCSKDQGGGLSVPTFNTTCVQTQHHERPVGNIQVYVRYSNPVFPGYHDLSVFDTMYVTDANGYLCIPNMPEGKSWLVGFGIDELIQDSVKGSVSVVVEHPKDDVNTVMYVTEVH
ncbi:MAG: hypothetical protein AAFV95_13085 [Bacteroidota bacterium]